MHRAGACLLSLLNMQQAGEIRKIDIEVLINIDLINIDLDLVLEGVSLLRPQIMLISGSTMSFLSCRSLTANRAG